jgi:hypothetical protein
VSLPEQRAVHHRFVGARNLRLALQQPAVDALLVDARAERERAGTVDRDPDLLRDQTGE